MTQLILTVEDLLAGANGHFDLVIPPKILNPTGTGVQEDESLVQIKPLTIGTFQLIMKAAKSEPDLIPILMIKESLVQPTLSVNQIKQMHIGLVEFLVKHIRQISGLSEKKSP